ncbi:MAG: ABC transporter ATP-binding protein [Thermodesulfobacteriota bacterium]
MIAVTDLCQSFGEDSGLVLDRISFSLGQGETLSVIGPSGCGKTTLLYILAGLQPPLSGAVLIEGERRSAPGGGVSFILQDYGLFPWKTVSENILLALKIRKARVEEQARRLAALLAELGLAALARRYPVQLSGGQKQRVAIARALAGGPRLLLMDEPFSSLDALTRERLQNTILEMWRRRGLTYVIVTHSVEEAVFLGGRIMVLTDRPTRVEALIENPEFGDPDFRMKTAFFEQVKHVRALLARTFPLAGLEERDEGL